MKIGDKVKLVNPFYTERLWKCGDIFFICRKNRRDNSIAICKSMNERYNYYWVVPNDVILVDGKMNKLKEELLKEVKTNEI